MSDQKTKTPRVRAPKTKAQRKAAAEASQRHRAKRKGQGLPTAAQIDTALVAILLKTMHRPAGLHVNRKAVSGLMTSVIKRMGWGGEDEAVRVEISNRIAHLISWKWPQSGISPEPAADQAAMA